MPLAKRPLRRAAGCWRGPASALTPANVVRQPLRQYLAMVSNLYRSFLADDKRTSARIPLVDAPLLPPLAMFHHDPPKIFAGGPYSDRHGGHYVHTWSLELGANVAGVRCLADEFRTARQREFSHR